MTVGIIGEVSTPSGFSHLGCHILEAARANDFEVVIMPIQSAMFDGDERFAPPWIFEHVVDDLEAFNRSADIIFAVWCFVPHHLIRNVPHDKTVPIVCHEWLTVHVHACTCASLWARPALTPCRHAVAAYRAAGYPHLEFFHIGFPLWLRNEDFCEPIPELEDETRRLAVQIQVPNERSCIEIMTTIWADVMKAHPGLIDEWCYVLRGPADLLAMFLSMKAPNIRCLGEVLTDKQINWLTSRTELGLYVNRGTCPGLPQLNLAVHGKPILAIKSGIHDYLDDNAAFWCEARESRLSIDYLYRLTSQNIQVFTDLEAAHWLPFGRGPCMLEPIPSSCAEVLEWALSDEAARRKRGAHALRLALNNGAPSKLREFLERWDGERLSA